jgi:spore coat polysaccharide biosynthesis protein SpsF
MKVIIITQARIGSTRFPGKVLELIGGESLLSIHLNRLKKSTLAQEIIVATTFELEVEKIINIAKATGVKFFQGSTEDVLDRFYKAGMSYSPDYIVRVTSDCPLIDPHLIDCLITKVLRENIDYISNTFNEDFPDGQDVEIFKWEVLKETWQNAKLISEREHVTPFMRKNTNIKGGELFSGKSINSSEYYGNVRMTVDEPEDADAIRILTKNLGLECDWKTYADYILGNQNLFPNQIVPRNEGYFKSLKRDAKIN